MKTQTKYLCIFAHLSPLYTNKHYILSFFPLKSVTNAWIQKYPNPHSLQVDQVDTISRKIDKETGELIIRRLISASLKPPAWMEAIGFPAHAYILEEAKINPYKKEMIMRSVNITGNQLLEIEEICTYAEDIKKDENLGKNKDNKAPKAVTLYNQKAIIESPVPLLNTPIEVYALKIHSGHAEKGLTAMKQICTQYANVGFQGFQQILQWRLDTVLLLNELNSLRNIDLKDINLANTIWSKRK